MKFRKQLTLLLTMTGLGLLSHGTAFAETRTELWTKESHDYGAKLPYLRYEAEEGVGSDAVLKHSTTYDETEMEASNQSYVQLTKEDSSLRFTLKKAANAMTLRFTMPENASGELEISVERNGELLGKKTLELDNSSAWQYVKENDVFDEKIAGSHSRFRFDERHFLLENDNKELMELEESDVLTIRRTDKKADELGIDFIELEQAPEAKEAPDNSISITDAPYSAVPNDGQDDSAAFLDALKDADKENKTLYIPVGTFDFDRKLVISATDMRITGAGIWHTQLHFTSEEQAGGGIEFLDSSSNVEMDNLYMDSELKSRFHQEANYKGIAGVLGENSKLHDLWLEHFECGIWVGDYVEADKMKYTKNLTVSNSRIRNNFADGVNFAQGTRNSKVQNSDIRGNGDDGLATFASKAIVKIKEKVNGVEQVRYIHTESKPAENNAFLNNTVELTWRASGIALHGGANHCIEGNLVKDITSGSGLRVSTVFPGYNFDDNQNISIKRNLLIQTGTDNDFYGNALASIHFEKLYGEMKKIQVTDNRLINSPHGKYSANFYIPEEGTTEITLRNNEVKNIDLEPMLAEEEKNFVPLSEEEKLAEERKKAEELKKAEEQKKAAEQQAKHEGEQSGHDGALNIELHDQEEIPVTANFKLYWFSGETEENGRTVRYWVKKLEGIHLDESMEYSLEDGTKVFNFTSDDIPKYIPISGTAFEEDYYYEGEDWIRWESPEGVQYVKIRYWSPKEA
ncbi:right-handed parallel beta-helix repeat-containing protein [Oribacterium parvum]|uniref:right-handed parallel beta-helix repeat-containing protein n=1 Tax=Oribacterium parvum TaxID=1501329 RepID=UPI0028EC7DDF|nr:right-handed parallel beta-helix repeat-containing protein [Oribacterium parvum]